MALDNRITLMNYGQRECVITLDKCGNSEQQKITGREVVLPMSVSKNNWVSVNWQAVKEKAFNGYYRNTKNSGVIHATQAYNRYKNLARNILRKGKLPKMNGDIAVLLTMVFPDNRRRDAQNYSQVVYDAMQESDCLFDDDSQITFASISKVIIKDKSLIVGHVFEVENVKLPFQITLDYLNDVIKSREVNYAE